MEDMYQRCYHCDKMLKPGEETFLERRISDNTFHANIGEVEEYDSQGAFPFGKACAKKILKNAGVMESRKIDTTKSR